MIAIIQRVSSASVTVNDQIIGAIGQGLLVLASIVPDDSAKDFDWMANKLTSLRIFRNADKAFDIDVRQVGGSILLVSNFTVAADARQGRRPSFDGAAPPTVAGPMFESFVNVVRDTGVPVETGLFGGDMRVALVNEGPATFILDSRRSVTPSNALTS